MELSKKEVMLEEKRLDDTIELIRSKISILGQELYDRDDKVLEFFALVFKCSLKFSLKENWSYVKKDTLQKANIKGCFGEKRKEEIFLLNQPKISEGDIIIVDEKKFLVEKVSFKYLKKEIIGQKVDAFLQVLN